MKRSHVAPMASCSSRAGLQLALSRARMCLLGKRSRVASSRADLPLAFSGASSRAGLQLALSGARMCLPGVCTSNNAWTLPATSWTVKDVLGRLLVFLKLDPSDVASLQIAKDDNGKCNLTLEPVSAVLTTTGEVADPGCTLAYCAENGIIRVHIGDTVLPFVGLVDAIDVPCADVDGITTPLTPTDDL